MTAAETFEEVWPNVFRWEAFSPEHKVELTSHAVVSGGRLYIFDPIPLAAAALADLQTRGTPVAIVLTNGHHERDAAQWRNRWPVPIWASAEAQLDLSGLHHFPPGQFGWQDTWTLHPIHGGSPGEIAFRSTSQPLVILGDAIVNLPGRDLELLPAKYCRDPIALRQSLRQLIHEPFDRLLLAHGAPLPRYASAEIARLL